MALYQGLSRAGLTFDFLHSTSTTHDFLFGAMAELLDNSRDAGATKMDIFTVKDPSVRGGFQLCFLDNGEGMNPEKAASVILFGESSKRGSESHYIGQYGNGLKSGSMRIGRDFILFTKQESSMTCLLMSRTFLEEEQIKEVIVPLPSFDSRTRKPLAKTNEEKLKHNMEMDVILKYSPFKTEEEFFDQFERIQTNSGTLVIVYHMKLRDNGEPELDIISDPGDVLMAGTVVPEEGDDEYLVPEKKSLRSYCTILYSDPKMKVYVQGQKVHTKILTHHMYKPRMYEFTSYRFKKRSEEAAAKALEDAKKAEHIAREAESTAREMEIKRRDAKSKEARIAVRQAQIKAEQLKAEANMKKELADAKKKALKGPKTVQFYFGLNVENRSQEGMFIFNRNRLIKMYERLDLTKEDSLQFRGIVGMVNVPSIVLEPTNNKQEFADKMEYRFLRKIMKEHMVQYWKDLGIGKEKQSLKRFWENYGYISQFFHNPPSTDAKYLRKRLMDVPVVVQCDKCLKWRILPFTNSMVGRYFDYWECSMNTSSSHKSCSSAEQKLNIPCKVLKKETKSDENKKMKLLEEIRKKQQMLKQLQPETKPSHSMAPNISPQKPSNKSKRPPSPSSSLSPVSSPERERKKVKQGRRDERRRRVSSPPPKVIAKTRPVGKARPVIKETKPVGKASPVIQKRSQSPIPKRSPAAVKRPAAKPVATPPPTKQIKKSKPVPAPAPVETIVISSSETEESVPTKPIKPEPVSKSSQEEKEKDVSKTDLTNKDIEASKKPETETDEFAKEEKDKSNSDVQEAVSSGIETESEVGINMMGERVEAFINGRWNPGEVVKVIKKPDQPEKWRVKFDRNRRDKFDKWYDSTSKDLRLASKDEVSSQEEKDAETKEAMSEKKAEEVTPVTKKLTEKPTESIKPLPRSSSAEIAKDQHGEGVDPKASSNQKLVNEQDMTKGELKELEELRESQKKLLKEHEEMKTSLEKLQGDLSEQNHLTEKISEGYRKCLRYFLPPSWPMTKQQISGLKPPELVTFDLNGVFEHYEKNLRELVGSYHARAESKEKEATVSKQKLSNVRRMVSQLLRTMTDTQDDLLPENQEGDEVDEILAVCLREATSEAGSQ